MKLPSSPRYPGPTTLTISPSLTSPGPRSAAPRLLESVGARSARRSPMLHVGDWIWWLGCAYDVHDTLQNGWVSPGSFGNGNSSRLHYDCDSMTLDSLRGKTHPAKVRWCPLKVYKNNALYVRKCEVGKAFATFLNSGWDVPHLGFRNQWFSILKWIAFDLPGVLEPSVFWPTNLRNLPPLWFGKG